MPHDAGASSLGAVFFPLLRHPLNAASIVAVHAEVTVIRGTDRGIVWRCPRAAAQFAISCAV